MPYPRILESLPKSAQQGGKRNNKFENLNRLGCNRESGDFWFLLMLHPEMVAARTFHTSVITHSRSNATAVRTLSLVLKFVIKAVL
jgi:hypothetical protein